MVVMARPVLHLGFDAHWFIGFGIYGEVIVAEKDKRTLCKYQMQPGSTFSNIWLRELPHVDLESSCRKAVSSTGTIFLHNRLELNSRTFVLSPDGSQIMKTIQHAGMLIGCLPPERLMYVVDEGSRRHAVAIIEEDKPEVRLRPETGHTWSKSLSVCQDGRGRTAVMDGINKTLDIISQQQRKSHMHTLV